MPTGRVQNVSCTRSDYSYSPNSDAHLATLPLIPDYVLMERARVMRPCKTRFTAGLTRDAALYPIVLDQANLKSEVGLIIVHSLQY